MDQRSWQILKLIADSPSITGKDLEKQLDATRKQIGYSIEKINEYLVSNEMPKINRLRTGQFQVSNMVIEAFRSKELSGNETVYIYSDKERMYLILLMFLCHDEELSTYHFIDELKISKNTLLLDIKKLQQFLDPFQITVYYSRKNGYTLLGSEFEKRELLVLTVRKILKFPNGEQELQRVCKLEEKKLIEIKNDIEAIEHKLEIKFTDARMAELPYILYLIMLRIKRQKSLDQLPEAFGHIVGTMEYRAITVFANKYEITSNLERIFLTAQIQISNIQSLKSLDHDIEYQLIHAAKQVMSNFEKISCVTFHEKEEFLEALIQHWKPAFYRMKYKYHLESSIVEMVLPQYSYLHEIVRKAVKPFEQILNHEIPDEEMVYFTVLFGSWLRREGRLNLLEYKKKAIVVCANGISVSNYLYISLKELLPEIEFLECLSVRDFMAYQGEFDIVFSTEHLVTNKIQFVVKPFLDEASKQRFRARVFRELEGIDLQRIQVSQLISIIEENATIHSKEKLIKQLNRYMLTPANEEQESQNNESKFKDIFLTDLLEETVQIWQAEELPTWEEAIRTAALPLLQNQWIEQRYIDTMISNIKETEPYIMISDGIIIAHAGIDDGVNKVAMSILKLPKRIMINGYMESDIIIVLGTPDKTSHLTALYQLNDFLEKKENLIKIRAVETAEQLLDLIKG